MLSQQTVGAKDQITADIGIISAYRFARDGTGTKLDVAGFCMLPPTLVTGFFGMNTRDMPFQAGDGGTWYALLLVIAAALTWWLLRRTKAL